ncbi:hypothetical protein GGI25_001097 [Coemansia spiralis]|uniref:Uncharacterized protein n=2 Tax=Coemansia TaxID=4863 RepID=A0A9W8GDE3_9FUNG|nr:hypothetical protein BX070DRAFT_230587 [Coemansia spiralis]KAJ1995529.1 hypothetical protein EDC05_000767 [Coemansia umbellata]KAJ2625139.1 hypothetical protein GGI26_000942 [Coemansia sp. RSA 1358]KAJ2679908.1 hypothetical protein GGI25_001097 [Coemansia spiralis]
MTSTAYLTSLAPRTPSPQSPYDPKDKTEDEFLWTPPPIDPNYWHHVAKARDIRSGIFKHRTALSQATAQGSKWETICELQNEVQKLEYRLLRYIDHYVLDYDDVVKSTLGTVSPPMSPQPEEPPEFASGSLPPTPAQQPSSIPARRRNTGEPLDSRAFIESYKKNIRYAEAALEPKKPKSRLGWAGLFGSKNVRAAEDAVRINPRLQTRSSEPALSRKDATIANGVLIL